MTLPIEIPKKTQLSPKCHKRSMQEVGIKDGPHYITSFLPDSILLGGCHLHGGLTATLLGRYH